MTDMSAPCRDKPWMFRTDAGHSTAADSNRLYRRNLAKGQTGLSIAFDLPTQTGYDSDHILARGEVGKVGVPVSHLGDMRTLFEGIPLGEMNTSMTINATAVWLMALYIATAEEQGAPRSKLQGTTQNDIIKEYLSRGSYVFPPMQSLRLTQDLILFTTKEAPKFNPMNVCSYHLQEAGAISLRNSLMRSRQRSPFSIMLKNLANFLRLTSVRLLGVSHFSLMQACVLLRNFVRCAPLRNYGKRSPRALWNKG